MPSGDRRVVTTSGRPRIAAPCDAEPITPAPDVDAVGPIAFSPDGSRVYFASPNEQGMVDLWQMDRASRRAVKLTAFSRDSYGPSVAKDGTVLFRTQSYRTFVAEHRDGQTRQLTSFQAETPWWHPREPLLSLTFGTWRRVIDDAKYPDIAQEIGVIDANRGLSDAPLQVIADSDSEDQAMAWSPNGRWIALHSHREQSDDVWLRPTDGSAPDRRITMLGRGAEVGWPRWSPDGRTVLLDGANARGRSVAYTIGVDQESGVVTSPLSEVATAGFDGDLMHAEWMPDGVRVAAVARDGPGRHALLVFRAAGGAPRIVYRVASEHDFPGLTVSPDGAWLGLRRRPDGYYQIFRVPAEGGTPE
jgi:Tol biopolymer transport system component